MRVFINLELEPEEFHIYIYTKSYFYRNLGSGRLQYLNVKKGEHIKAHLSLQVKHIWSYLLVLISHSQSVIEVIFSNLRACPSLICTSTPYLMEPQIAKMTQLMIGTR